MAWIDFSDTAGLLIAPNYMTSVQTVNVFKM